MIRLVIVDDHPVVCDGLSGIFGGVEGFEVVGVAEDGARGVELVRRLDPDVVLMDLRMLGMDGVIAIRELLGCRVLVLMTFDFDSDVLFAIEVGAIGYLLKDVPCEELYCVVRVVVRGELVLLLLVALCVLCVACFDEFVLSACELEVFELVVCGSTNCEAVRMLFISEAMVKIYLLYVYAKLGVFDRVFVVVAAFDRGLLWPCFC